MIKILGEDHNKDKPKYPYLGKSNLEQIVLFTNKNCGLLLTKGSSRCEPFEYSEVWDESMFIYYDFSITIINE